MKIKILISITLILTIVFVGLVYQLQKNLQKADTGLETTQNQAPEVDQTEQSDYSDTVTEYLEKEKEEIKQEIRVSQEDDESKESITYVSDGDIGGVEPNPKTGIIEKKFDPTNFNIANYEDIIKKYNTNWYERWAKHDIGFLEKFNEQTSDMIDFNSYDYDLQPYHIINNKEHLYSPDKKYLLNVVYGGDPDTQVDLVNLGNKKVKTLLNCGTACLYENGYWFDDDNFMVVGTVEDYDYSGDREYYDQYMKPVMYLYNLLGNMVTVYEGIKVTQWDFYEMDKQFMKVNVFLGDCHNVKQFERVVPKSEKISTETLKAVFRGTYSGELDKFHDSIFSYETKDMLKEIIIKDGIAYVNLEDFREYLFLGSRCDKEGFFEQANRSLIQYSTIKDVVYFIEGTDDNFYKWYGMKCPFDYCEKNPFRADYAKLIEQAHDIREGAENKYNLWYDFEPEEEKISDGVYIMKGFFRVYVNIPFNEADVQSAHLITKYGPCEPPVIKEMEFHSGKIWYTPGQIRLVYREQDFDIIFELTSGQKLKNNFKLKSYNF